ncbi:MAG TPA: hypothetical protein VHC70_04770, partial [Phycisphaerales bacterium]|nr:hypothetical protein [Phycisphaerales bacterium]
MSRYAWIGKPSAAVTVCPTACTLMVWEWHAARHPRHTKDAAASKLLENGRMWRSAYGWELHNRRGPGDPTYSDAWSFLAPASLVF